MLLDGAQRNGVGRVSGLGCKPEEKTVAASKVVTPAITKWKYGVVAGGKPDHHTGETYDNSDESNGPGPQNVRLWKNQESAEPL